MAMLPKTKEDLESALPDISGSLRFKGLDTTVEIYRDSYGIPHVKAGSVHDAFFGQGFVTAQDRLWHMDHDRRLAYGRWAEYAGEAVVAEDLLMRRFQIRPSVEDDYATLNRETRAMLDAYAEGVNAFIQSTESPAIEYSLVDALPEPWQSWDCLAVFKVRHIMMGVFEAKLWRARLVNELGPEKAAQILPGSRPCDLLIVPPGVEYEGFDLGTLAALSAGVEAADLLAGVDVGSNNWALSGSRTASSKPLLAGDPHRALEVPNVYYQNHIACPEFDVVGLSFPGCPGFPHFGHNAHVAWCVTHAQADYQDLYLERFKKRSPALYEFKGEWKKATVCHEVVNVRGGAPVELDVSVTDHGPVIVGDPASGYAVAFKYTATDGPNLGFQCWPRMLKAASSAEIEESMREWVDPCNNFLFADVHGDVGYLTRGRLPVRSMANAWLPVPGWTGEHEWQGFVPFEELPRSHNPETGYIVTANNRIAGEDYPHYIALAFSPEYRARRITERLNGLDKAAPQDMTSIHADRISIPAESYARLLSRVEPLDEFSARAQQKLLGWKGSMDRDGVAPTIYSAFRRELDGKLLNHLLGPLTEDAIIARGRGAPVQICQLKSLLATMAAKNDSSLLPSGTDWGSLMAQALADGMAYLRHLLGDAMDTWTWGRVHFTRPRHTLSASFPEITPLLDPPSMPLGGDEDTPQAASYHASDPFTITGTSVARYLFDLGDWNSSAWVVPLGASGHPGSPHYVDQAPIWGEIRMVPMLYDWEHIAASSESRQELKPRRGSPIHI